MHHIPKSVLQGAVRHLNYQPGIRKSIGTGRVYRSNIHRSVPSGRVEYDVIIIGGGVVGVSISRLLALRNMKVCVVEMAFDLGEGASKSNSAIVHTGFDADPGSLEAQLVTEASLEWPALAAAFKIPYEVPGALMVADTQADSAILEKYYKNAKLNHVSGMRLLSASETMSRERLISQKVGSLLIEREALIDPFSIVASFSDNAWHNGADFYLGYHPIAFHRVGSQLECSIRPTVSEGLHTLVAPHIINAAGLGATQVAALYDGAKGFDVNPRRGQFLIYDMLLRDKINHILLPVPSPMGKGVLISPTIFGNLIAGPTAEDLPLSAVDATQVTRSGLQFVKSQVEALLPLLKQQQPIGQYAGARANCKQGSFIILHNDGWSGSLVCPSPTTATTTAAGSRAAAITTVLGIRSTGITTCNALAKKIVRDIFGSHVKDSEQASRNQQADYVSAPLRKYPNWFAKRQQLLQSPVAVNATANATVDGNAVGDPTIVCYCQSVSRKEIEDLLSSSELVSPHTDTIKRRTRAMAGRCQGFNCLSSVCNVIAQTHQIPINRVSKKGPNSEWFPQLNIPVISSSIQQQQQQQQPLQQPQQLIHQQQHDSEFDYIIIGGGPSGLGAFRGLSASSPLSSSLSVLLLERASQLGGVPKLYSHCPEKKTFWDFSKFSLVNGSELANKFIQKLPKLDASKCIELNCIVTNISETRNEGNGTTVVCTDYSGCSKSFVAKKGVILATGSREATIAERFSETISITGHRPARVVYSSTVLRMGGIKSLSQPEDQVVAVGAGLVGQGTTHRDDKINHSAVSKTVLIPLINDAYRGLADLWFGSGVKYSKAIDEVRFVESSSALASVDMYHKDQLVESIDLKKGLFLVADNLVPNDELIGRPYSKNDSNCKDSSHRDVMLERLHHIGNVYWRKFPASLCYAHGWLVGKKIALFGN